MAFFRKRKAKKLNNNHSVLERICRSLLTIFTCCVHSNEEKDNTRRIKVFRNNKIGVKEHTQAPTLTPAESLYLGKSPQGAHGTTIDPSVPLPHIVSLPRIPLDHISSTHSLQCDLYRSTIQPPVLLLRSKSLPVLSLQIVLRDETLYPTGSLTTVSHTLSKEKFDKLEFAPAHLSYAKLSQKGSAVTTNASSEFSMDLRLDALREQFQHKNEIMVAISSRSKSPLTIKNSTSTNKTGYIFLNSSPAPSSTNSSSFTSSGSYRSRITLHSISENDAITFASSALPLTEASNEILQNESMYTHKSCSSGFERQTKRQSLTSDTIEEEEEEDEGEDEEEEDDDEEEDVEDTDYEYEHEEVEGQDDEIVEDYIEEYVLDPQY